MMKQTLTTLVVSVFGFVAPLAALHAQAAAPRGMEQAMPVTVGQEVVSAEVKKVDKDTGRITLAHGDAKSLGLPAATAVYAVRDPAMLEGLSEGAKVRVALAKSPAGIVVLQIEPVA